MLRYFLVLLAFAVFIVPAYAQESHMYDYYAGSLTFDTILDDLSCDSITPNPTAHVANSLDIDGMDDHFFIILGKTDSGKYHYMQIQLPDDNGMEDRESYLLDFRNDTTKIRGELFQDYDQMAIYLETNDKSQSVDEQNYKLFLTGDSKSVSPSSYSLGPGQYSLNAVLFQSDRSNWLADEVCAVFVQWKVYVDYSGNITPGELKTQVGRIYPSETDSDALAETGLTEISSSVLTGIKIIEFGMFDSENYENSVHQLYVGKKYWFVFEYQNESEKPQDVEEFVKLIDKNKTEDNVLQKIQGSTALESSKGSGGGFSWTPEYVGEFEITAKVVSHNDSLVGVIAPQYDLVVIERPVLKQQIQNQIPIDDILCKKSDHFLAERTNKNLACVSIDTAEKLGWKLVHFEKIILDPATKKSLLERYSDLPEVVAFYEKYDANAEVRQDHISYFVGNGDDFSVRMNLELDKNHDIENIEFHCYAQRVHQMEVAQENILNFLKGYTCDETGAHRNKN